MHSNSLIVLISEKNLTCRLLKFYSGYSRIFNKNVKTENPNVIISNYENFVFQTKCIQKFRNLNLKSFELYNIKLKAFNIRQPKFSFQN